MNVKSHFALLAFVVLVGSLVACGGDDRLDSLEAKFTEITRDMSVDDVNALVGEPESFEELPDSAGGKVAIWADKTRVLYDSNSKVT